MKRIIFSIFLFAGLLSSCENYLDPGYDEYLDKDEVFKSYTYSLNYVRAMYSYLPGGYHSIGGAMEAALTDEAKHSDESSSIQIMNNGSWDSRTYLDAWTWGYNYAGIRRVHVFLENVNKAVFLDPNSYKQNGGVAINDSMRRAFRAEAKFLRAFYYFELLKRYGDPAKNLGVPIVPEKSLAITDTLDYARNSYSECVNYIVRDCDSAALRLPGGKSLNSDYGKATKGAALALKSRVLLYAASPLANPTNDIEKWKLAADAAKAVMKLNQYKLIDDMTGSTDNLLSIFTKPNNDEVIFSSSVSESNSLESMNYPPGFSGRGLTNPTQDLVDAFETNAGYPITHPSSGYKATDPYYRRDKRLEYFIFYNGLKIGTTSIDPYVGGKDGINGRPGSTKTGYYLRKFMDPAADILTNRTKATHFWVHFRYAEILLNYAEAMAHVYGPKTAPTGELTAFAALKQVRNRQLANKTTNRTPAFIENLTTDEFLAYVRNERRVELCFEGHRFWDVRRWKLGETFFNKPIRGMKITKSATNALTYEVIQVENRVFDQKMYSMPIPYSEMLKSQKLVQNEGW